MVSRKIIVPIVLVFVLFALSVWIYLVTNNKVVFGYNINYQPSQPIAFSHKLHAGKYKIDCRYCHSNVDKSRQATVPSLNICMNCHLSVKAGSPLIRKLSTHYINNKPVEWQKVHLLPDYVRFNHSKHIKAGKQCQECHGQVQNMTEVFQKQSLSMGWCVDCHRKKENQAPTSCVTCHY